MIANQSGRRITRRALLGRTVGAAAAAAAAAGRAKLARAQGSASPKRGVFVGKQPTGSEIWQVTTEEFPHSNIYCEVPYCSKDSRYFVYGRTNRKLSRNRTEFMVVELGEWRQHRLDVAASRSGCAISPDGVFYYLKEANGGELELMRADLSQGTPERIYQLRDGLRIRSLGTVSRDGRYYAGGTLEDPQWTVFGIALIDLKEGKQSILDRDPFILNPHPQFEPGEGRTLMIQHNRGGQYTREGERIRLVGPEGATLYVLSAPGGKRTELQVGKPYTTPCTGHEAWIGDTKEMLLSVSATGDYAAEKGNLLGVRAGGSPRVVSRGYKFGHVGVSRCGRLFSCDDWQGEYKLVIGATQSGQSAVVCESKTKPTSDQSTHPHPYLTPDLKWVVFNSSRSGFPHIYAASVPEEMAERLTTG